MFSGDGSSVADGRKEPFIKSEVSGFLAPKNLLHPSGRDRLVSLRTGPTAARTAA
jgi:hypothetical protein